jgi:hypothetical protein
VKLAQKAKAENPFGATTAVPATPKARKWHAKAAGKQKQMAPSVLAALSKPRLLKVKHLQLKLQLKLHLHLKQRQRKQHLKQKLIKLLP